MSWLTPLLIGAVFVAALAVRRTALDYFRNLNRRNHMIELGDKVECRITGFQGVATARMEYINGCVQYLVKPRVGDDGKMPEGEWLDEAQLEAVAGRTTVVKRDTGGPVPGAPKRYGA